VAPEVIARVRQGLSAVVNDLHGTGGRARVPGVLVAGKTGTSQVVRLDLIKDLEDHEVPIRYWDHALFAAFAPVDEPEIAIAVVVEHAGRGGGAVAAPIAQRVLAKYFEKKKAAELEELEAPAEPDLAPGQATASAPAAAIPSEGVAPGDALAATMGGNE